ncbi:hypothetical protein BK139_08610 [Paenibacillus sp. FSL R5-0490]|nr:hypothetical protein BK139_08610 [Paenibacillus sp. FSL R5-0490]
MQVLTQKGEKRPVESEPGATSDTERRKEAGRVRTWFNFGHRKAETMDLSRNPGQLGTQQAGTVNRSRNPGQLRTQKAGTVNQSQNSVQLRTQKSLKRGSRKPNSEHLLTPDRSKKAVLF